MEIKTLVEIQGGRVALYGTPAETKVVITVATGQNLAADHDECQREIDRLAKKILSEIEARDRAIAWAERMERERNTAQQAYEIEIKRANDAEEKVATYYQDWHTEHDRADRAEQAREIETKRAGELAEKVRLYDVDRYTERDRADRAQAREKGLGQRVAELETSLARYVRAHACTDRCTKDAHVAFEGNQLVKELEQELANERDVITRLEEAEVYQCNRAAELDHEVKRLHAELERRFTTGQLETAKADARADGRESALVEVGNLIIRPNVDQALARMEGCEADYIHILGHAVQQVRDLISQANA